ncbi:MAG: hypothetical protein R2838_17025 [Caldilineaceae bacterium]
MSCPPRPHIRNGLTSWRTPPWACRRSWRLGWAAPSTRSSRPRTSRPQVRVRRPTSCARARQPGRHDLIYLAGHFSAGSALAADYRTRLLAREVAASDIDLRNAVVFSGGCPPGYNIVARHPRRVGRAGLGQALRGQGLAHRRHGLPVR